MFHQHLLGNFNIQIEEKGFYLRTDRDHLRLVFIIPMVENYVFLSYAPHFFFQADWLGPPQAL